MLTRDRRRFASQAIWYFLRQDYAARELIIIDDSKESIGDLIPSDSRLRYVRLDRRMSSGAKRNLACELSTGEFIAHWDDDAWFAPQRLRVQITNLENNRRQVGGLHRILYYEPLTGRLWRYAAPAHTSARIHSGSLCYRRSYWQAHPFPDRFAGEEGDFLSATPVEQLSVLDGAALVVAVVHGGSAITPNQSDPRWQPCPFHELSRLLDIDLAFYAGLHSETPAPSQRLAPMPITLAATFMVYDGYGSMAEYLALGLARAGADLQILPFRVDPVAMSSEFRSLWQQSQPNPEGIVLCHAWWGENLTRFGAAQDLFIKTVWETSRLPADWPARLNRATAVIVPSQFTARVFRASGVSVPVEVAYEGIDPEVYQYQARPERDGLTTLVVGVLAPRKNIGAAVAAWKLAFAGDPNARLIIKARFQLERYTPDDPRIQVVDANEPTRGIAQWYQQADVLLTLGNEGFGLPLIEGMATGLPVVALNSEAQADICTEAAGLVLPVQPARWENVQGAPFGPCGVRAIPSVEDAARQLRWVADHRQEAQAIGRSASAWARKQRNVWDMGPAVLDIMERRIRSTRPLRRTWALWAPRNARWFDVSFYAAQLAKVTMPTRLYEQAPGAWRAQILHIQHTPGVLDDQALARQVLWARQNGIPVLVTQHLVAEQAEAWEQHVDVLVALTAPGVARLKQRWRHKRVELMPSGCPSWRPSHRRQGGRTIAVIGQPGPEQGVQQLLETLHTLSRVELIVFGTVPKGEEGEEWLAATQGLPLRYTELPSSDEELARQLGNVADVIVFWHEESPYAATNYAARIALASGVPVLTSHASEFDDLAGVVFRSTDLAVGVEELFTNLALRVELANAACTHCQEATWQRVATSHLALWRTLPPS